MRKTCTRVFTLILGSSLFFSLAQAAPAQTDSTAPQQAWSCGSTSAARSATVTVRTDQVAATFKPEMLAATLPAWMDATPVNDPLLHQRVRASGVKFVRISGAYNDYGWLSCELGEDQPGAVPCGENWGSWVARPSHYLSFLKETNTQAIWVVSPKATPQEAAALVAFFNSPITDTTVIGVDARGRDWLTAGYWAQWRASKGFPDPVPIRYWEIGHEMYSAKPESGGPLCQDWGWQDLWTCNGTEYVLGKGSGAERQAGYLEMRAAMRAIDPTIQVGAIGYEVPGKPTDGKDAWQSFAGWGSRVIQAAGDQLDFYAIHPYPYYELPANPADLLAKPQSQWRQIMNDLNRAFRLYARGRKAPVAVTEYRITSDEWNQDKNRWTPTALNMLHLADAIGQAALNGVSMFSTWRLAARPEGDTNTNSGMLQIDNQFFRAPHYYVFPLWSRVGDQLLRTSVRESRRLPADQALSVYAGTSDPNTVNVLVVNKSDQAVQVSFDLLRFGAVGKAQAYEVCAAGLGASNVTFNGSSTPSEDLSEPPQVLSPAGDGQRVTRLIGPHSLTLLQFQRAGSQ